MGHGILFVAPRSSLCAISGGETDRLEESAHLQRREPHGPLGEIVLGNDHLPHPGVVLSLPRLLIVRPLLLRDLRRLLPLLHHLTQRLPRHLRQRLRRLRSLVR